KRDLVLLTNGDRIEGLVESWDETAKELKVHGQPNIAPSKLAAIAFSTELDDSERMTKPYMKVVVAQGSRLSLTDVACDGNRLTGKTLFGVEVRIPIEEVVELTLLQGPAVYLSDLKPARVD